MQVREVWWTILAPSAVPIQAMGEINLLAAVDFQQNSFKSVVVEKCVEL